jgi:hypothetical protein
MDMEMSLLSDPEPEHEVNEHYRAQIENAFLAGESAEARARRTSNHALCKGHVVRILGWPLFRTWIYSQDAIGPLIRVLSILTVNYVGMLLVLERITRELEEEVGVAYTAQRAAYRAMVNIKAITAHSCRDLENSSERLIIRRTREEIRTSYNTQGRAILHN